MRLRAEFVQSHDKRNPIGDFANFMVGLDGLVAGCMAVTFAALAGSLLGFLLWNWSPAACWPHARVSSLYIAATALLAGLWLDQRVAVPFAVASQS